MFLFLRDDFNSEKKDAQKFWEMETPPLPHAWLCMGALGECSSYSRGQAAPGSHPTACGNVF